jgi:hypothetical protein
MALLRLLLLALCCAATRAWECGDSVRGGGLLLCLEARRVYLLPTTLAPVTSRERFLHQRSVAALHATDFIIFIAPQSATAANLEFRSLKAYEHAVCNDGSPSGYYFQAGGEGAKEWLVRPHRTAPASLHVERSPSPRGLLHMLR